MKFDLLSRKTDPFSELGDSSLMFSEAFAKLGELLVRQRHGNSFS
jgi:hypothetical protein